VRALFEQAGVIRVETLTQLFDTALLLAYQPLPAGPRVAVVGNSSALGVLVADALLAGGMELAGPPVDVGTAAPPEEFAAAVASAIRDDPDGGDAGGADALIAVFVPPIAIPGAEYARALRAAVAGSDKPVAAVFLAVEGVPAELSVAREDGSPGPGSVPSYPSPERAAAALARVSRYAAWRARPVGEFVSPPGIDTERARAVVARLGAAHDHRLADADAVELLACYGIPVTDFREVSDADAAVAAAEELGYPVAIKAVGDRWRHRTDLVGVRLDLDDPLGVRRAHADLARLTGQSEVYVQRMAPKGISCVLEIVDDPSFGSLLSFGLSGMATAAPSRSTCPRWRTWCCGWAGSPRTCPRCARSCSTPCSPPPRGRSSRAPASSSARRPPGWTAGRDGCPSVPTGRSYRRKETCSVG
jgi:acyl-CoA synthetase (NDP forming)